MGCKPPDHDLRFKAQAFFLFKNQSIFAFKTPAAPNIVPTAPQKKRYTRRITSEIPLGLRQS